MSITLIQSDPMNSMNHNLPHFSIIIKQDYSFHLYKQNVIPYYPTHLVYLSQVSSQHKHPIIFQPPYNYSFLNRIINNYYCHVSITTISTIQIYAFSSILKYFLVTICMPITKQQLNSNVYHMSIQYPYLLLKTTYYHPIFQPPKFN